MRGEANAPVSYIKRNVQRLADFPNDLQVLFVFRGDAGVVMAVEKAFPGDPAYQEGESIQMRIMIGERKYAFSLKKVSSFFTRPRSFPFIGSYKIVQGGERPSLGKLLPCHYRREYP